MPTAHATGLVSVGGAIWAHLTQQRLERGAKIAVVGEGTAGQLAVSLAGHLGYDVYQLSEEPVPPLPEKSSKAARKAHKKRLHAADEALREAEGAEAEVQGEANVCRWALAEAGEVPRAKTAGCRKTPPRLRW